MKKIFVLFDRCLLALLVTALLLTMPIGCGGRIETDDSGQPTESFLQEIATDFSAFMNSDGSTVYTVDACYGIYDHCIAVEFSGTEDASKARMEEIAGTVFSFWSGRDVWIWQNGDFFTLGDAYEKELLTDEQVRAIADARNNGQIETDAEGKPTERFLQNVAEDYANHLYQNHPFDVAKNPLFKVRSCYGIYNDCAAVMFSGLSASDALRDVEVGGIVFPYTNGASIEIWKDGNILSLQEAYDQGALTKADLQSIADIQNQWYYYYEK